MDYCINCGKEATMWHHVVPRELGGKDSTNLVPLCDNCHGLIHGISYRKGKLSHSELTKIGIQKAKAAGKQIGGVEGRKLTVKKEAPAKAEIKRLSRDFDGTLTDVEVMKIVGLARNTYYKYKKKLKEENI